MSKVLVTGGAGFIGGHLVRRLTRGGARVRVLDNLSSGRREALADGVELLEVSVLDREAISRALADVDVCFHLAAIASVAQCNDHYAASHAVNLTGFINILEAVRDLPVHPRVIYASSAAVYGSSDQLPLSETGPTRPTSPYGADKLGCELHAAAAAAAFGIPSVGLRFFNVYGPGQDPSSPYSGVISRFLERVARGDPLTIHGDGLQSRDFVHVDDVVESLIRVSEVDSRGSEVFNVCTGQVTTVRELARVLADENRMTYAPTRDGDVRHSQGDPSALKERTGFCPSISLDEGLAVLAASSGVTQPARS